MEHYKVLSENYEFLVDAPDIDTAIREASEVIRAAMADPRTPVQVCDIFTLSKLGVDLRFITVDVSGKAYVDVLPHELLDKSGAD